MSERSLARTSSTDAAAPGSGNWVSDSASRVIPLCPTELQCLRRLA